MLSRLLAIPELPEGPVISRAFVEELRTLAVIVEHAHRGRLFLQSWLGLFREALPNLGFSFIETSAVRAPGMLVALASGPAGRNHVWVIDPVAHTSDELQVASKFNVSKLLGPAEVSSEVLCVCSDAVEHHLARLSVLTGRLTVLRRNIGARW